MPLLQLPPYLLSMLLHVAEGVFSRIQNLEVHGAEAQGGSNVQILGFEVLRRLALEQLLAGLFDATPLQELTANYTWCTTCGREGREVWKQNSFGQLHRHFSLSLKALTFSGCSKLSKLKLNRSSNRCLLLQHVTSWTSHLGALLNSP